LSALEEVNEKTGRRGWRRRRLRGSQIEKAMSLPRGRGVEDQPSKVRAGRSARSRTGAFVKKNEKRNVKEKREERERNRVRQYDREKETLLTRLIKTHTQDGYDRPFFANGDLVLCD